MPSGRNCSIRCRMPATSVPWSSPRRWSRRDLRHDRDLRAFDRLLEALDGAGLDERLVVQHGESPIRPAGAECVDFLPFDELVEHMRDRAGRRDACGRRVDPGRADQREAPDRRPATRTLRRRRRRPSARARRATRRRRPRDRRARARSAAEHAPRAAVSTDAPRSFRATRSRPTCVRMSPLASPHELRALLQPDARQGRAWTALERRVAIRAPAASNHRGRHPRATALSARLRDRRDGDRLLGAGPDLQRPRARGGARAAGRADRGGPLDRLLDEPWSRRVLRSGRDPARRADRGPLRRAAGSVALRGPLVHLRAHLGRHHAGRLALARARLPSSRAEADGRRAGGGRGRDRTRCSRLRAVGDHRPAGGGCGRLHDSHLVLLAVAPALRLLAQQPERPRAVRRERLQLPDPVLRQPQRRQHAGRQIPRGGLARRLHHRLQPDAASLQSDRVSAAGGAVPGLLADAAGYEAARRGVARRSIGWSEQSRSRRCWG